MKNLLKKIWNWVVNIPADKLLHYIAGELINLLFIVLLFHFCPLWLTLSIADIVTVAFLVGKEIYDSGHEGHSVELWDILAGIFGMLTINLGLLLILL